MKMTPSATLAMSAKAAELSAKGVRVISFAVGEPDFDTPSNIKTRAKNAIDSGLTKYPPSSGLADLKEAIREKLKRDNGLAYSNDEIAVTCGAKHAIYNALQVMIDPGDEVIVPAPYWVSYPDHVLLAGGEPVIAKTRAGEFFKLTPVELKKFITKKTRAIILNSPSNPTGSAYTRGELSALGEILTGQNIAIISDEIYEKLIYGDFRHESIAKASPPARDLTVVVNGVSKAYAMTGWRMGYAAGPREIIKKIVELSGQQITGIPPFVQKACIEALSGPQDELARMRAEFCLRRDLMFERLSEITEIHCHKPEGAFYLLPNMDAFIGRSFEGRKIDNSDDLAEYLLGEAHIATVSGEPFGAPGHIRFSYATSRENIEEGMRRLKDALSNLK